MIYTDQLGYLTKSIKIAISTKPCNYQIIRVPDQHSVADGVTSEAVYDESAEENVWQIDFTDITEEGEYYVLSGDKEKSHTFKIGDDIYRNLQNDVIKCLYYQRCGVELKEEHAGEYVHGLCHSEPSVMYEDYINNTPNPKLYDMTGGWHDAGDYGRYTTPACVAVAHLLYAYELFPESFKDSLNIPESGNGIPDVLNECMYELKWLLKMQGEDGGVSHKLTAFKHADFIMPEEDKDQFIIYPVSSMATAGFVAVMALACRIYKDIDPEFCKDAMACCNKAILWLNEHPYTGFHNADGSGTGEYDDESDLDERLWAACEMIRADVKNRERHIRYVARYLDEDVTNTDFGWTDVSGFAAMSVLTDPHNYAGMLRNTFEKDVVRTCQKLLESVKTTGYLLGMKPNDFVWGSNMVVLNRAMLFVLASLTSTGAVAEKFSKCALEHIHYILGRNPMDISYVTGYGENAYMHPHSRVMECDGIEAPIPGWVSGGPFKNFCDEVALEKIEKGTAPMKCYIDDVGSYSTNEITIYWNTPLAFLCAFASNNDR